VDFRKWWERKMRGRERGGPSKEKENNLW